jgi:hydrogenase nickel incorporation protein HypA/HybF
MHEFSVCQALLEQVQALAQQHGASAVERIAIQVGPLSGVEPALLAAAFAVARGIGGTGDAELIIESLPVRVHCLRCGSDSEVAPNRLLCRSCGSFRTELLGGDELWLRRVEFCVGPAPPSAGSHADVARAGA